MLKKIKISYLIVMILLSSWGYYYYSKKSTSNSKTSTTTYEIVGTGSLKESIDVVGSAQLVDEQSLRFNQLGTITKVNFKDGDKIKAGDIIAEIDNSDGQTAIKEAQINLENAKINLTQLYESADESQILQAQNTVSNAQKNLEISYTELENLKTTQKNSLDDIAESIENAKKELTNLNTNLEISQKDLEISQTKLWNELSNTLSNKSNTIVQLESSFLSEQSNISKILDEIDIVLWITQKNKDANDDYELYLWAKNSSYKNQAENYFSQALISYNEIQEQIKNYTNAGNINEIESLLVKIQDTYRILQKATDSTYQTIDNSISSSAFSESTIASLKANMYNYKTNTENKITSLNSSINTLNTLTDTNVIEKSNASTLASKEESIKSQKLAITKKQQEIANLEKNLSTTKTKNEIELATKLQNIESANKSLEVSKQNLKELLEWPTQENITKAKNSILQAELKLQDAQESLKDYQLESPFDGVVRKIDYKVWDKLLSDSDKYVYIENPNLVEIPVSLDQVDIVKVNVGTKANITFDAYPTITITGVIHSIDYTPVKTSGVVTYTAYLIITDTKFDKKILSGMTADIEIVTQEKDNILTLSSSAITTEDNKYYVNLVKNRTTTKTQIETWLTSWGKTEIVSGLHLGDKVAIIDISSTTTSTKTTTTSLFWAGRNSSSNKSSGNMGWPPGGF